MESAAFSVDAGFDDIEQYPTAEEKAARLAYALIADHAFVDGNKRGGVLSMLMTLRLNGIVLHYTQKELIELGLSAANGIWKYVEIYNWIMSHKQ